MNTKSRKAFLKSLEDVEQLLELDDQVAYEAQADRYDREYDYSNRDRTSNNTTNNNNNDNNNNDGDDSNKNNSDTKAGGLKNPCRIHNGKHEWNECPKNRFSKNYEGNDNEHSSSRDGDVNAIQSKSTVTFANDDDSAFYSDSEESTRSSRRVELMMIQNKRTITFNADDIFDNESYTTSPSETPKVATSPRETVQERQEPWGSADQSAVVSIEAEEIEQDQAFVVQEQSSHNISVPQISTGQEMNAIESMPQQKSKPTSGMRVVPVLIVGILLGLLFGVAGSLAFSPTSTSITIETSDSLVRSNISQAMEVSQVEVQADEEQASVVSTSNMSNSIMQSTNTQHIKQLQSKSSTKEESTVSSTSPTKEGRVGQDSSTSQSIDESKAVATSIIKSQTQDETDTQAVAKNVKNSSVELIPKSTSDTSYAQEVQPTSKSRSENDNEHSISSQVESRDGVEVQARPEVDNEQPTSISRSSRQVDDTQVESIDTQVKSKLDITTSSDAQLDITSDAHIKSDIEADAQLLPSFSNKSNIKTPTDSREVVVEQTTSQDTSHTSTRDTLDEYEAVGQENPPDLINTSNTTHDIHKSMLYTLYTNELNIRRSIDPIYPSQNG